jgi:hypothetical protein
MIEAYAFLAAFTIQILLATVLHPAWFIRYVRVKATSFPVERFAQLFPGVDRSQSVERFVTLYRAAYAVIAVLGVLLLGWLFNYMRRADWNEDPVIVLHSVYSVMQMLPLVLVTWLGFRFNKVHRHSLLEGKRKAILQRRGLFDFISPFIVFLAVSGYFLFVAFVTYVQREPFPGFALIGVLTLVFASQAFVVYRALYGKKSNPLETHAGRVHTIGLTVKSSVYGFIVCVVFFAFVFTVDLLDLKRWVPLAQSVCLLITTLLCIMSLTAPPRGPEVDELGSSSAP